MTRFKKIPWKNFEQLKKKPVSQIYSVHSVRRAKISAYVVALVSFY